jgi:protein kinase A
MTAIMEEGSRTPAALYLVRSGRVEFKRKDGRGHRIVEEGGYFGEDTLTADLSGNVENTPYVPAKFTVSSMDEETVLGELTLEECRIVIDTTMIGKGQRTDFTSIVDEDIPLRSLKRHGLLGAGTFGQVWLTSKVAPDGTNRPYALKVQSKHELIQSKQVKGVIRERNIMSQLKSPFLIRLVQTYQDEQFIYMLLGLVQGGELYSVLHTDGCDGVKEGDAKFYSAGILEGLAYMHRRQIVYRDLKPENVMIAYGGYPVLIDLGFAKIVETKSYTLCGTPLYLAPEVILNQGHNSAADHWSLGILMYEMIAGYTPFYAPGIDQITLYRFVVKGEFSFPGKGVFSSKAQAIIRKILVGDPRKRLGSLAGGLSDLFDHPWFSTIDFAALRRKEIEAPFAPTINDPLDMSQFDNWDHVKIKNKDDYPKLNSKGQAMFNDF